MLVLRACTEWLCSLMLPRNLRERVCVQHILLPGKCQVPLTTGKCWGLMRTTVLTDLWLLPLHGSSKDMIVLTGVTRPTCLPALACPKPLVFWWLVWHMFVSLCIWAGSTTTKQTQPTRSLTSQPLISFIVHAPKTIQQSHSGDIYIWDKDVEV